MFKSYIEYEREKVRWVLDLTERMSLHHHWKGISLEGAIIRQLWLSLNDDNYDRALLFNHLYNNLGSGHLLHRIWMRQQSFRSLAMLFPGVKLIVRKISWLFVRIKKPKKGAPLVVVHHWKFVNYIKSYDIFNGTELCWLVDKPSMIKELGLGCNDNIIPQEYPIFSSLDKYPLSAVKNLAISLELSIMRSNPSAIFTVEGDAPYHSLLAELGVKHGIPVYCFQWGILHPSKLKTAFSKMRFTKFLSWGEFFEKQLAAESPGMSFLTVGHLSLRHEESEGSGIIFLSQGQGHYIEREHQQKLITLAIILSSIFPGEVFWRPHPSIPVPRRDLEALASGNVNILDELVPLRDHLKASKIAVGIGTSSLVDALQMGVVPVIFNPACMESYPFPIVEKGLGLEYADIASAYKGICTLYTTESELSRLRDKISIHLNEFFLQSSIGEQQNLISKLLRSA